MKGISKNKRILSIFLISCLIFGLISSDSAVANVSNKPDFDLELSVTKQEAIIGEDIIINGRIIPKPFETEVPAKEIVLVLDVSGSMKEEVNSLCDMDTIKYCTNHGSSVAGHWGWYHNWVDNYCELHETYGEHNSKKIDELKKAANNFIDKMKDVPNLKIGIVTYSTEAVIKKYTNKALIPASNVNELKGIINGLTASGGTNTGEGLRKATYLLSSSNERDETAIKTVVLMSDGMPTYRTVNDNAKDSVNFYLNTDVENRVYNTSITGNGSSDDGGNNTKYAMGIGGVIDTKNYNVFSIGYGMDSTGTNKLREIHKSMSGLINIDNSLIDKGKGFFVTSDGAINNVFDQIADKILDSYPVNNIDLNITFNSGFSLNIGGNTVKLDTVNYKKVSESQNDKIRYEAEPVPFQFIVKGSEPGNKDINSNVNITFPWKDKTENLPFNKKLNITIKPNELPPISAKLISGERVAGESGQVVKVKYQIEADDFIFQDSTNLVPNDVVIVLDVAKDMENKISIIKNSLWNRLLNNNTLKQNNTKYGIVTYSNAVKQTTDLTSDITYLNDNVIKNIGAEGNINNSKNIGETFQSVINILEGENGRPDAHKNIIFMSQGKVSYNNYKDIELLKNKGYNIISLETDFTDKENTLYNMHNDLGALGENYFNIANGDYNQIENIIMSKIADRIINTTTYKPYDVSTKLHFNLGDNFNAIEGFEIQNNNNIIVNVPTIRYDHVGNGKYVAEKIDPVEFSVIVKENKLGDLTFGQNPELNKIVYKRLLGGEVNIPLRTPIINVQESVSDLVHGLYGGIKNTGIVDIIENEDGFEIGTGSNVTFGAKFLVSGNNSKFNINVDSKLEEVDLNNIKVYKTIANGSKLELKELKADIITSGVSEKSFDIIINNIKENNNSLNSVKSEIVVIYTAKVNKDSIDESFINTITFSRENFKNAKIFTRSKELPDLF